MLRSLILPLHCRANEPHMPWLILAYHSQILLLGWKGWSRWGQCYWCTYLEFGQKHHRIGSSRRQLFLRWWGLMIKPRLRMHQLIFHRVWINGWEISWCIECSDLLPLIPRSSRFRKVHMRGNQARFPAKSTLSAVKSISCFLLDFLQRNLLGKRL